MISYWYIFILGAYALNFIPIVGRIIIVINTYFHELGHALASILTNGKVHKIQLFSTREGTAYTSYRSKISFFITAIAGYISASLSAFGFFYLLNQNKYDLLLLILIILIPVTLFIWIRNMYGLFWSIGITLINLYFYLYASKENAEIYCYLIAFVLLTHSVYSAFEIFKISLKKPKEAGDATNLYNLTKISPRFWALFFFIQSLYFAFLIFKNYIL